MAEPFYKELESAARDMVRLFDQPEPGLHMWMTMLAEAVVKMNDALKRAGVP